MNTIKSMTLGTQIEMLDFLKAMEVELKEKGFIPTTELVVEMLEEELKEPTPEEIRQREIEDQDTLLDYQNSAYTK